MFSCLHNYYMASLVDIIAKRRRNQPSLHPSSDVSPPYARYILGVAGQIVMGQSLPRSHTLAFNLVCWVEARAKLDALCAVFIWRGPLSFILFSWCPQHSQFWLRWKTCSKSLLGIPLFSSSFPFMDRPGLDTWVSSIHGPLLFSPPRAQWPLQLSLTLDTHADHRNISGRRFERITSLRKCYVRS